jgi:endoglucanase
MNDWEGFTLEFYNNFKSGVNIGGWLSQYDVNEDHRFNEEEKANYFKNFITEQDIKRIASWGADHVRLPIMADIVYDEENPEQLKASGLYYIDQCLEWCEKHNINVLLDLHELEGHANLGTEIPPVLSDEKIINKCAAIWKGFAKRYIDRKKPAIVFELLNEVHDPTSYLWIRYYKRMVAAIREIDQDRIIMIGTNDANSPFRFAELDLLEDDNIVYNFHYYDPFCFTHQVARFSDEHKGYGQKIHYPGKITGYVDYLQKHPEYARQYPHTALDTVMDRETALKYLQGVLDFIKYTGKEVYCGEFGVVDTADMADRCGWAKDIIAFFKENKIGFAYWNYKEMDFGLVDKHNALISNELLEAVFGTRE